MMNLYNWKVLASTTVSTYNQKYYINTSTD